MRILQANKFFYRRGGAEVVFFDTIKGLRARGHEVIEFSMQHPKNMPSEYSGYFASEVPELLCKQDLATAWKIFRHLFVAPEIVKKIKALALATDPQVAHLHNIYHHLSASTFTTLHRLKIPIVLTVHDVFPLCPNHSLLYGQSLREDLFKKKLYNCVRYKCIDNRLLPSIAGTLEAYYYHLKGIWEHINLFICPSQFMMDKMVEYGFPKKKMRVVLNPFEARSEPMPLGNRVVYLGRMHYEKGIRLFLEAATHLRDFPITVAGTGPDDAFVDAYIKQYSLTHVERLGWVESATWQQVMASARVIVVPSLFYENCSLTVLEALSFGRIVVGVNRGGTPEMIIDGQTGFLAKPENADDLAVVIKKAIMFPENEAKKMVERGRSLIAQNHTPNEYFKKLENIYAEVIKK